MSIQVQREADVQFSENLSEIVTKSRARPHMVTVGKTLTGRTQFTVHTVNAVSDRKSRRELLQQLRASEDEAGFRIKCHSGKKIGRATSLEKLNAVYGKQAIAIDPTGAFQRSRSLVVFASKIRRELGDRVAGIYWNSSWQTIYVVLDHTHYLNENKFQKIDLLEAERTTCDALLSACGSQASDFVKAVRLSFQIPSVELVPVDARSYWNKKGVLSDVRRTLNAPMVATVLGLTGASVGSSALAADPTNEAPIEVSEPAVSGPNAKIAVSGGFLNLGVDPLSDDNGFGAISGSITVPLSERFGAQIDGAVGTLDDGNFYGIGGHLFWRDPSVGLFGVIGGHVEVDRDSALFLDQSFGYVAAETEIYLEEFTFSGVAGGSFGDNLDDGFFGSVDFGWYATDDLYMTIGAATSGETSFAGTASVEWQPAVDGLSGMTFFAEGAIGSDDFASVNAGIRFYFGEGPTLKDRHRRDDPTPNAALAPVVDGAVRTKTRQSYSSSYSGGTGGST